MFFFLMFTALVFFALTLICLILSFMTDGSSEARVVASYFASISFAALCFNVYFLTH